MSALRRVLAAPALAGAILLAAALPGVAAPAADWDAAKRDLGRIVAAMKTDRTLCARMWDIVWPFAVAGEAEARAILAAGMFVYGLRPPGADDAFALMRHSIILTAYGAVGASTAPGEGASASAAVMRHLFGLLQTPFVRDLGGDRLKTCLDEGGATRACLQGAVREGFVPDFADYAAETELLARHAPARCAPAEPDRP